MSIQIVRPDDQPREIRRCGACLRIPGRDFPSLQSSESVEFFLPHPLNPKSKIQKPVLSEAERSRMDPKWITSSAPFLSEQMPFLLELLLSLQAPRRGPHLLPSFPCSLPARPHLRT